MPGWSSARSLREFGPMPAESGSPPCGCRPNRLKASLGILALGDRLRLIARAGHEETARPVARDGPAAFDLSRVVVDGAVIEDRAVVWIGAVVGLDEVDGGAVPGAVEAEK